MNKLLLAYFLQFLSLSIYILIGYYVAGFVRLGLEQWLLSIIGSLLTTYLLNKYKNKKLHYLSVIISGTAVFLIASSLVWYSHLLLGSIAVLAKAFITDENDDHIFNPAGIAILICIILFPKKIVLDSLQFITQPYLLFIIITFGLVINFIIGRLTLSMSYFIGYLIGAIGRSFFEPESFQFFFFPVFNPTYLIFIFHMLSDPKVSPKPKKFQFIAGVTIALIDHLLRQFNVLYSPLIALSLFTSFFYIYKNLVLNHRTTNSQDSNLKIESCE